MRPSISETMQMFNDFDVKMANLDPDLAVETWKGLEAFAIRRRLIRRGELAKAPGAKVNGAGLRFKSWLQSLFRPAKRLSQTTRDRREALARKVIQELDRVLDLAWGRFADTIREAK